MEEIPYDILTVENRLYDSLNEEAREKLHSSDPDAEVFIGALVSVGYRVHWSPKGRPAFPPQRDSWPPSPGRSPRLDLQFFLCIFIGSCVEVCNAQFGPEWLIEWLQRQTGDSICLHLKHWRISRKRN